MINYFKNTISKLTFTPPNMYRLYLYYKVFKQ